MALNLFGTLFGVLVWHGIFARSIQNTTEDDSSLAKTVARLEEKIENLTRILEESRIVETNHVLFFVRLSASTTLNTNSIVKFDEVGINEGNHFNSSDGIFVAPISGVYQFSWTTITDTSDLVETELRVDNVVKETMHVNLSANENINSGTKVVFCKVKKGDHVWIQTSGHYASNFFRVVHAAKSSFAGMLIYRI